MIGSAVLLIGLISIAAMALALLRAKMATDRRLLNAIAALPEGVGFYDKSDRLYLWNEAYAEVPLVTTNTSLYRGVPFGELLRKDLEAGLYLDAIGREEDWLKERMALRLRGEGFQEQHLSDGRWLRVADRHTPDGGTVTICVDITERVESEREREKARTRYQVMAEEASDIIVLHEHGQIVFASDAMWRLLKRKPEEMQGGQYLELVHPDDMGEALRLRGRPPPGEVWSGTYRVLHAEGHYLWFEVRTRAKYDELTGEFLQEISVGREITERKEQELKLRTALERAEAANKAKSMFLATMSHELRTPLNAILGFSEIMKEERFGSVGNARYRDYAGSIHSSGVHLLSLINDILDISKLESGHLELNMEPVELNSVITDCLQLIAPQAEKSGIHVDSKLDAVACVLQVDRKRLRQMLLNLLSNALKFTPDGGRVSVSTLRSSKSVTISVTDTGIGMEVHAIPKALEYFGQIDNSLNRKYDGSGLGLPLTKRLAELHGAKLTIESELGIGTTVRIVLATDHAVRDRLVAL